MKKLSKRYVEFALKTQWLWDFLFLPLLNLLAFRWADPLRENISHIANVANHSMYVLLWACSCAIYLLTYTAIFANRFHYTKKIGWMGLFLSTLFMIASVLIPYLPDTYPLMAKLHINIAMIGTLMYVIVLFLIFYDLYFYEPSLITNLLPWYILIVGGCSFLFLLMGNVSTLVETMFVVCMGIFWHFTLQKTSTMR